MNPLGFIFTTAPHTNAKGREGLDALLATSAFSDEIEVFFTGGGVAQLLDEQDPQAILSRDYISAFKLMELYDIERVFVCQESLQAWGIEPNDLLIDVVILDRFEFSKRMRTCRHLLTF